MVCAVCGDLEIFVNSVQVIRMKPTSRRAVLPEGRPTRRFGCQHHFFPPSKNRPELVLEPLCTTGLPEPVFGRCGLLPSVIWAIMLEYFMKHKHLAWSFLSNRKPRRGAARHAPSRHRPQPFTAPPSTSLQLSRLPHPGLQLESALQREQPRWHSARYRTSAAHADITGATERSNSKRKRNMNTP